ncbi:TPA: holin [Enterococcus faecium]|nr:holin [Enterococcus faecium]
MVLGFEVSKIIPYVLVAFVGLFVGVLYVLKSIRDKKLRTISEKVAYIFQGIGSSMLITWISYEITKYFFNLPDSLSVAISGGIGYLGSESVSVLVLKIIEKRL